jgi:conjugal transfer pilus assembly protein TraW
MGKLLITIFALVITSVSYAKNLGVWGAIYPVVEQDIKEFILQRLTHMQQNGELEQLKDKFIANVKEHSLRPEPVLGLTTTDNPKTFYYDPTFVLNRDIEDATGHILFSKGTKTNPLSKVKLHSVLLFFNADDKRQITWALYQGKQFSYVKYILTQGNIKDAGTSLNNRIYFDQYGTLTKKFGITHIPCLVMQEGLQLKIQEFKLKEEIDAIK